MIFLRHKLPEFLVLHSQFPKQQFLLDNSDLIFLEQGKPKEILRLLCKYLSQVLLLRKWTTDGGWIVYPNEFF